LNSTRFASHGAAAAASAVHHEYLLHKGVSSRDRMVLEKLSSEVNTNKIAVFKFHQLGCTNVGDMEKDDFYQFLHKTYIIHPVLLSLALYALGGAPYLVWGMAVRLVWVYHVTWFVNSASHVWGTQPWNTGDLSKNNWWVAMVAYGEGWHNNHHAFEYSARHGLKWWQLDPTWWTILGLGAIGLATKIKLPRPEHMKRLATKSS
jgi:fatty-acid desaturase